ncbi:MAG: glycosyltransferase [Planctomycetota bacterium]
MIFVTAGSLKGFDRLVRAVDELVDAGELDDEVFAQIGRGGYEPRRCTWQRFLSQDEFKARVEGSSLVLSHVGVGTILLALEAGVPVVTLPRRAALGEHVNDHQLDTARQMEADGLALVAWEVGDLAGCIRRSRDFRPSRGTGQGDLVGTLRRDLTALGEGRWRRLRRRLGRQRPSS